MADVQTRLQVATSKSVNVGLVFDHYNAQTSIENFGLESRYQATPLAAVF
jgi:hypothetical protein